MLVCCPPTAPQSGAPPASPGAGGPLHGPWRLHTSQSRLACRTGPADATWPGFAFRRPVTVRPSASRGPRLTPLWCCCLGLAGALSGCCVVRDCQEQQLAWSTTHRPARSSRTSGSATHGCWSVSRPWAFVWSQSVLPTCEQSVGMTTGGMPLQRGCCSAPHQAAPAVCCTLSPCTLLLSTPPAPHRLRCHRGRAAGRPGGLQERQQRTGAALYAGARGDPGYHGAVGRCACTTCCCCCCCIVLLRAVPAWTLLQQHVLCFQPASKPASH